MPDNIVRNIAPFINDRFMVTSPWWTERINPITGELEIHRRFRYSNFWFKTCLFYANRICSFPRL